MPTAKVRGVDINYKVLGTNGPWVALSPGGRRSLEAVETLAEKLAAAGYRVVIHDRRNCGLSDVVIAGDDSEYVLWADDLYELLSQLDALPAIIGGSSSGCRTSLLFALRHPRACTALLLWRITGGDFAAKRLAFNYYTQYIDAAKEGGMAAVCALDHFGERCEARPASRDTLMSMDVDAFVAQMEKWRQFFLDGADLPVIGATQEDLAKISVPTIVVPGNDRTHGIATGKTAHRMIPNSEIYLLFKEDQDIDLGPLEDWFEREEEMAGVFLEFLARHGQGPAAG